MNDTSSSSIMMIRKLPYRQRVFSGFTILWWYCCFAGSLPHSSPTTGSSTVMGVDAAAIHLRQRLNITSWTQKTQHYKFQATTATATAPTPVLSQHDRNGNSRTRNTPTTRQVLSQLSNGTTTSFSGSSSDSKNSSGKAVVSYISSPSSSSLVAKNTAETQDNHENDPIIGKKAVVTPKYANNPKSGMPNHQTGNAKRTNNMATRTTRLKLKKRYRPTHSPRQKRRHDRRRRPFLPRIPPPTNAPSLTPSPPPPPPSLTPTAKQDFIMSYNTDHTL